MSRFDLNFTVLKELAVRPHRRVRLADPLAVDLVLPEIWVNISADGYLGIPAQTSDGLRSDERSLQPKRRLAPATSPSDGCQYLRMLEEALSSSAW